MNLPEQRKFIVKDLGTGQDYHEIWELQEKLVKQRREDEIPDTLLLLEHSSVYTIGRTRDQSSLGNPVNLTHPVIEINRGGQGTYHGPGQLVGYAILDLKKRGKDLHRLLRNLEEGIIRGLSDHGVNAHRREKLTGVWVDNRKIASLGVGVRSWISMHGFALNISRECLQAFDEITPCGISGVEMTCVESESKNAISMAKVKESLSNRLGQILNDDLQEESAPPIQYPH